MVRKKFRKKEILLVVFFTLSLISIFCFYIWHRVESLKIGYEISDLEKKVQALMEDVEKLETEKAQLLSPENVEKIAKEKLGLIEPREDQIIHDDSNFNLKK